MGKRLKKPAQHLVHAVVNPTNLLHKDFAQKVAKDAQSGFGVLNDKQAKLAGQIAPIVTAFIPGIGPLISAGITATNNFANTGKIGPSLLKGGLSYVGGQIGSNLGAGALGGQTFGDALGDAASNSLISGVGNNLGTTFGAGVSNALGTGLGNVGGSFVGSQIGNSIGDSLGSAITKTPDATNFQAYRPQQQDPSNLPPSLQGFGSLNPTQQSTNIANQGVYGGGLGADEQSYFTNLINRRLIDQNHNVSDINSLKPIESSYLSKLGLGGYGNSNDLLQAISKWHAA